MQLKRFSGKSSLCDGRFVWLAWARLPTEIPNIFLRTFWLKYTKKTKFNFNTNRESRRCLIISRWFFTPFNLPHVYILWLNLFIHFGVFDVILVVVAGVHWRCKAQINLRLYNTYYRIDSYELIGFHIFFFLFCFIMHHALVFTVSALVDFIFLFSSSFHWYCQFIYNHIISHSRFCNNWIEREKKWKAIVRRHNEHWQKVPRMHHSLSISIGLITANKIVQIAYYTKTFLFQPRNK